MFSFIVRECFHKSQRKFQLSNFLFILFCIFS